MRALPYVAGALVAAGFEVAIFFIYPGGSYLPSSAYVGLTLVSALIGMALVWVVVEKPRWLQIGWAGAWLALAGKLLGDSGKLLLPPVYLAVFFGLAAMLVVWAYTLPTKKVAFAPPDTGE